MVVMIVVNAYLLTKMCAGGRRRRRSREDFDRDRATLV